MVKPDLPQVVNEHLTGAVGSALTEAGQRRLTQATSRAHLRVFKVDNPVTVFVRGSGCRVVIRYHDLDQVDLFARFYYAFGVRFVAEQDEAGVYIVVKRRRFVGRFSRAEFILQVPHYAHLALNLTPGGLRFDTINGLLRVPPVTEGKLPTQLQQ